MSNLSNTPGGGDLPDRYRNVGEQIQAFFDYAEKNPDRAVPFFVNIWETQASLTTRALALQGLGVAAKHYLVKEAFADWDVLKDIAKEVKGKGEVSNDLTRWAAASALEAIGYSQQSLQHLEGGGFTEPLDRIRREIRDRKLIEINRIPRLNTRGETTAEYQRNLEFWVYGPVEELFAGNDHSPNYQELVKDVIRELHGRGVYLGLISPNLLVQAEALLQAGSIFKESAEIENFVYPFLEDFLHNPNQEISFRINAAEIINTSTDLNRRLKTLSKLLLEEKNPKLQEVALRQSQSLFKRSAEIEDFIYGLLEQFLHNPNNEASLRIAAAEIIYTARDLSRKLKTLIQLLLENTELRNAAVRLLTPYKQELARVESNADTVLDALIFEYRLNQPEPKDLTISQMENYISSTSQDHKEISARFTSAIAASESLARRYGRSGPVLKQFLENKQDEYLSPIESLIQVLKNKISETKSEHKKVQSNQALINEIIDKMDDLHSMWGRSGNISSLLPIPEKICVLEATFVRFSTESHTYNQSYKIQKDLRSIKFYLIQLLTSQEKIDNDTKLSLSLNLYSLLDNIYTVLAAIVFWPITLAIIIIILIISIFDVLKSEIRDNSKTIIAGIALIMLYLSLLVFVTSVYRWEGFSILLIVIILFHLILWEARDTKRIKRIQSLIDKLNTQWQE
ncbi:hypothetical protein QT971_21975 [Microcoleus sp. herbarium19]|uniref:hypothetical protein n=1 Tax=unclassified Microcoleus TaxID=2642155 RepID=UPI002FD1FEC3